MRSKSFGWRRTLFGIAACALLYVLPSELCAEANLPEGAVAHFEFSPVPFNGESRTSEMSPDGKLLAMWSAGSATLWDNATGLPVKRFYFTIPAAPGYQRGFAFSPDGKRLAGGPSSELIIVWDLATGKEVRRFTTEFEQFGYSFLRFSADSASLIVESKEVLSWFDIETGKATRQIPHARIKQLSPDEKTFVVVVESRKEVLIGATATGTIKHTLPIATLFGDSHRGVVFLPDGDTIAVVCHEGSSIREVQFWDFKTGKRQKRTWTLTKSEEGAGDYSLVLSPDGKILYFPEQRKAIRRFSLATNEELEPITLNGGYFFGLFAHPDGRMLFGIDGNWITRWDAATLREKSSQRGSVSWQAPVMSPNGRWLARHGDHDFAGLLDVYDTKSRKSKRIGILGEKGEKEHKLDDTKPKGITWRAFAFASDSQALVANQNTHLQFFNLPDISEGKRVTAPKDRLFGGGPLTFSPNGRYVGIQEYGVVRVFDFTTEKDVSSFAQVSRWLFTPDGKRILTVSTTPAPGQVVRMHELATQKLLYEEPLPQDRGIDRRGYGANVTALAFSPDAGICAMAMSGGHVVLLDAAIGKENHRFLGVETSEKHYSSRSSYLFAIALAFSADGQWLVVCADGLARIWDVATRRELHRFPGFWGPLLAFSDDGRRLFSFGEREGFLTEMRPQNMDDKAPDAVADLLARDGPVAYRAIWILADNPRGPALLREKFAPKRVDARPERIARLIADLDADAFKARDAAMKALADLERNARPALLQALKANPALETARRINLLLADLTPEITLRNARAVKAMELSGTSAARQLLEEWAAGSPGLYLTDQSRAALSRRGRK